MSRDSWATPMAVYMAMDSEFDFHGDMCASDSNAKHPFYITEADDALSPATIERVINHIPSGNYVWINPPYSNTTPWVGLAIQLQERGIGSVVLAMDDSSVGWYWDALQHSNEIREVVKGRIAFINAETGKPVSGNNKGSKFLIFDPYGRQSPPRRTYIERDQLMNKGSELIEKTELLFPYEVAVSPELEALPPELESLSPELHATDTDEGATELERQEVALELELDPEQPESEPDPEPIAATLAPLTIEPEQEQEPQTEFTPEDLHQKFWSGELKADDLPTLIVFLVGMFGVREKYNIKQVQIASVAASGSSIAIDGLDRDDIRIWQQLGRALTFNEIEGPIEQMTAAAASIESYSERLAKTGERRLNTIAIRNLLKGLPKGQKVQLHERQAETNEA